MTPNDQVATQINAELRPRTAGEEVAAQVGVVAIRALTTAAGAVGDLVAGTISAVNSFASNPEVQAAAASALGAAADGVRTVAGTAAGAIAGTVQTITDPVVQAAMHRLVAEGGRRISGAASDVAHGAAELASRGLHQLTAVAMPGQVPLITASLDNDEFMLCKVDADGEVILEGVTVPLALPASAAAPPAEHPEEQAPISTTATLTPDGDGGEPSAAVVPPSPAASGDRHEQPLSALLEEEARAYDGVGSPSVEDDVISMGLDSPLDPAAPGIISKVAVGSPRSPITPLYSAAAAASAGAVTAEPMPIAEEPAPAPASATTTSVQKKNQKPTPKAKPQGKRKR